jgi:hypothetical protein
VFGFNKHSFILLTNINDYENAIKNLHREFFEIRASDSDLFEKINNNNQIA